MKHVKAFAVKFVSNLILLSVILGFFFNMQFRNIFLITLVLCAAAYLIGDLLILPRTNNTVATIIDFGLAFVVIWLMSENLTYGDDELIMSLIAAIGVALFEYMFHRYLSKNILSDRLTRQRPANTLQYQTEASKELTPVLSDVMTDTTNEIMSDEDLIKQGLLEDTGNKLSEADPENQPEQTPKYLGDDDYSEELTPVLSDVMTDTTNEIMSDEDLIKQGLLEDTGNRLSEADPENQPEQTPKYLGDDDYSEELTPVHSDVMTDTTNEIMSDEDLIKQGLLEDTGNRLSEADPENQPEQTPKYLGGDH
ncbi:YndM family protein [Bacillus cereus]|nr:YndM family protein [Bacillus cereus]MDA2079688.1 YndM family protein [Bacillus cereus]MDA2085352.1 YndM family protein [Bacillus cereus]